jgi:hypothetical protein
LRTTVAEERYEHVDFHGTARVHADAPETIFQYSEFQMFRRSLFAEFASGRRTCHSARMSEWVNTFNEVFDSGVSAYRNGTTRADKMFSKTQQVFLGKIGSSAHELFDYVEDHCRHGEPEFETIRDVTAIRLRYFTDVQHGIHSQFEIDPKELPEKSDELAGIRWLPRIIAKARAKLKGELDGTTMFGCGGDRPFVRSIGLTLPEFLQLVWDSGADDQKIIDAVKLPVGH